MKHIFGPVPSRRLGLSLGVDLVPMKVCSLDCLYCEVGKTTSLTSERMEYVKYEDVINELEEFLNKYDGKIDFITLSGSGEPSLNSRMGDVVKWIKRNTDYPVAILTNGTLLNREEVREEMMPADVVLPSLDTAVEGTFRRLNRPAEEISLNGLIDGIRFLVEEFSGEVWLETLFVKGINDKKEEIESLAEAYQFINPQKVQLNTVDRPPAWNVKPVSHEFLVETALYLNRIGINAEVIKFSDDTKNWKVESADALRDFVVELVKRRPATIKDISLASGVSESFVEKLVRKMESEGLIEFVQVESSRAYSSSSDFIRLKNIRSKS